MFELKRGLVQYLMFMVEGFWVFWSRYSPFGFRIERLGSRQKNSSAQLWLWLGSNDARLDSSFDPKGSVSITVYSEYLWMHTPKP